MVDAYTLSNIGMGFKNLGMIDVNYEFQDWAFRANPGDWRLALNYAVSLQHLKKYHEAIRIYEKYIEASNFNPLMTTNLGCLQMLVNPSSSIGFSNYLSRWKVDTWTQKKYHFPFPHIPDLSDKTFKKILIVPDQGFGDGVLSIPFIYWLYENQDVELAVLAKTPQENFYKSIFSETSIKVGKTVEGEFDGWLSPLDIPAIFPKALETYQIYRNKASCNLMKGISADVIKNCCGLVWRGNPEFKGEKWRKLSLQKLLNLAKDRFPDSDILCAHIDVSCDESNVLNRSNLVWNMLSGDYLSTAHMMGGCHFFMGSDTGVMHLAGLMGISSEVFLGPMSEAWHWSTIDGYSFWYPTVKVTETDLLR